MDLQTISDRIDYKLSAFELGLEIDEYNKSLYLTSAQTKLYDDLVSKFEQDGDLSKDLEPFIKEYNTSSPLARTGVIANSVFFSLPTDLRKPVYEAAILTSTDSILNGKEVKIKYTKLAEVSNKIKNPFREPNYEEILRVITYNETSNSVAELIPPTNADISIFKLKYLEELLPIILEDLPSGLEINGVTSATNSKFHEEMLDKIIDLSVDLILKDKSVFSKSKV